MQPSPSTPRSSSIPQEPLHGEAITAVLLRLYRRSPRGFPPAGKESKAHPLYSISFLKSNYNNPLCVPARFNWLSSGVEKCAVSTFILNWDILISGVDPAGAGRDLPLNHAFHSSPDCVICALCMCLLMHFSSGLI